MKHPLALLSLFLLPLLPASAIDQKFLEPVTPVSPTLKAQGGASTANAEGIDALFANPAAFANPKISFTFADFEVTGQSSLSGLQKVLNSRADWGRILPPDLLSTGNPMLALANDLVSHGGLGSEESFRLGWVGGNLGVGLALESRVGFQGDNLLKAKGTYDQTYVGVIGMAWPFDVGLGNLKLGGALRPMQRSIATASTGTILAMDLNQVTIQSGFGLGWDLGARWDYANFKTGLVIRDAGSTVFGFKEYTATQWIAGGTFPLNGSTAGSTIYRVPTVIALGTNWLPDMGTMASLVQPSLSLDFQIPIKDEFTQPSFFTWTHLGAELKFLQMLSIRTGLNQGYFTFGMGVKVFVVDFNLAVYSDEMGRYSGTVRRPGLSLNLAVGL